jgi:hypothetical protein
MYLHRRTALATDGFEEYPRVEDFQTDKPQVDA